MVWFTSFFPLGYLLFAVCILVLWWFLRKGP